MLPENRKGLKMTDLTTQRKTPVCLNFTPKGTMTQSYCVFSFTEWLMFMGAVK